MRRAVFIFWWLHVTCERLALRGCSAGSRRRTHQLKREYADVLALQGSSKSEILAIARFCGRTPRSQIDRTVASVNTVSTAAMVPMVTSLPSRSARKKTVLYEFDASGLIAAGLDPAHMKQLPERGQNDARGVVFPPNGSKIRITPCDGRLYNSHCY